MMEEGFLVGTQTLAETGMAGCTQCLTDRLGPELLPSCVWVRRLSVFPCDVSVCKENNSWVQVE